MGGPPPPCILPGCSELADPQPLKLTQVGPSIPHAPSKLMKIQRCPVPFSALQALSSSTLPGTAKALGAGYDTDRPPEQGMHPVGGCGHTLHPCEHAHAGQLGGPAPANMGRVCSETCLPPWVLSQLSPQVTDPCAESKADRTLMRGFTPGTFFPESVYLVMI